MKKVLSLLLTVAMVCTMSACGSTPQVEQEDSGPEPIGSQPVEPITMPQPVQESEPSGQSKILIAYFSLWNNAPWAQEGVDTNTSASVVVDESGTVSSSKTAV